MGKKENAVEIARFGRFSLSDVLHKINPSCRFSRRLAPLRDE